jgi:hypothetical protein
MSDATHPPIREVRHRPVIKTVLAIVASAVLAACVPPKPTSPNYEKCPNVGPYQCNLIYVAGWNGTFADGESWTTEPPTFISIELTLERKAARRDVHRNLDRPVRARHRDATTVVDLVDDPMRARRLPMAHARPVHREEHHLLLDVRPVRHADPMTRYSPEVVTGLMVLVPPGAVGQPITVDVSTAGEPGRLSAASAVATWPGAVSVSWAQNRHDWTRVLEAINTLDATRLDAEATTWAQEVTVKGLASPVHASCGRRSFRISA